MTGSRRADADENAPANQPKDDRAFWNESWKAIDQGGYSPDAATWENEREEMLLEFLRPFLPRSGTVAEVGCGKASLLARIGRERQVDLVAVDYAEEALTLVQQSARAFGVKITTYLDDVNQMKFPDNSFDFILSGGLMEHFKDPRPALAEMVRVLKPGGVFYAGIVPRKLVSLHRPLHRILGPQVYRTKYGQDKYAAWMRELGCREVTTLSKGFYPPLFHHLPTTPRRAIERTFRKFDGTWLADRLGYFFALVARKPA